MLSRFFWFVNSVLYLREIGRISVVRTCAAVAAFMAGVIVGSEEFHCLPGAALPHPTRVGQIVIHERPPMQGRSLASRVVPIEPVKLMLT